MDLSKGQGMRNRLDFATCQKDLEEMSNFWIEQDNTYINFEWMSGI